MVIDECGLIEFILHPLLEDLHDKLALGPVRVGIYTQSVGQGANRLFSAEVFGRGIAVLTDCLGHCHATKAVTEIVLDTLES